MISSIYPKELKVNKADNSDISAAFLDLDLSIDNGKISSKIYDKRDDFNFDIVNFPFLDGDVLHLTVCTSLSQFVLQEPVLRWRISIGEIK